MGAHGALPVLAHELTLEFVAHLHAQWREMILEKTAGGTPRGGPIPLGVLLTP